MTTAMMHERVNARGTHTEWLMALLEAPLPAEPLSDCAGCSMAGTQGRNVLTFRADTKCCTYWPTLPNYLVGGILSDTGARGGAERVRAVLAKDWAVPRGLGAAAAYRVLYSQTASRAFGQSELLLCPYFVPGEGNCSIWRYRSSVCSTWFCRTTRAAVGQQFWDAAKRLLRAVERTVSFWCATELGVSGNGLTMEPPSAEGFHVADLDRQSLDGHGEHQRGRDGWGPWRDRREEFYCRCHELASGLEWSQVVALGGVELRQLAAELVSQFGARSRAEVPANAVLGSLRVVGADPDSVTLVSHRETQPLRLDGRLFASLRRCQGQSLAEARASMENEDGVVLSDQMLQDLCDARVLVSA